MHSFTTSVKLSWVKTAIHWRFISNENAINCKPKHVIMLVCSGSHQLALMKNEIKSRVVMLTGIVTVIPFYFSYAFFFLFSFFKISKALYSKAIPVSLFLHSPADSKCLWWKEWAELSLHHNRHNLFCFLLKRKEEGRKGRGKQGGQKRSVWDEREKKKVAWAPAAFI